MATITMSTVRAALIAKGMLKADQSSPSPVNRSNRASNLAAVASRKQELGYWPTVVYKQRRSINKAQVNHG